MYNWEYGSIERQKRDGFETQEKEKKEKRVSTSPWGFFFHPLGERKNTLKGLYNKLMGKVLSWRWSGKKGKKRETADRTEHRGGGVKTRQTKTKKGTKHKKTKKVFVFTRLLIARKEGRVRNEKTPGESKRERTVIRRSPRHQRFARSWCRVKLQTTGTPFPNRKNKVSRQTPPGNRKWRER